MLIKGKYLLTVWLVFCTGLILLGQPHKARAFWFGADGPLLKINDMVYNEDDFRDWWQEWREPESQVPEDLTLFIEWQLQVQEARNMELDENPAYKRKLEVFLKSRSLMLLRQEEIGQRMQAPEPGQLRTQYDETLQPIIDLEILQVADQETAAKVLELGKSGSDLKAAAIESGIADPKILRREKGRPSNVSEFFHPLFAADVAVGTLHLMEANNGVWLLIKVVAKTPGSDEDFAQFEEQLRRSFFRKQEPALNVALISRLRQKYSPVINREVLDRIDDLEPNDPGLQETIMTIGDLEIPAWQVVRLVRNETKTYRDRQGQATRLREKIQESVLANIEVQTMISLEAHNRHYELKPPFKSTYKFYSQRRLIKELEKAVVAPQVEVTSADLENEYKKMVAQFSKPDVVEVAWVQMADPRLSQLLAEELKQGHDFFKVMEPYFPQGVEYAKVSEDQLQSEIRDIVKTLAPGQVSAPVQKGEDTFFVKLFRRFVDQHLALDDVSDMLRQKLQKEQYTKVHKQLLATLKNGSKIVVNKSRWRKLRAALLREAVSAEQPTRAQGDDK